MISLHHVSKQFGEKNAVSDLTLTVNAGEVIGFLGVNGAGKTTTMRMITGILKPTRGTLTVSGHIPSDDHIAVARKVGYLPENNPLYPDMKVYEYLDFVADVKGHGHVSEVAASVGLSEMMDRKIETLSRGYKQRVGLAAALLGEPSILILDEPTSGLDPIEQDKIRLLIRDLAKEKIIIFSTHILSEVEDIANRIVIINRGKLVYDGPKPSGVGAVERLFKDKVSQDEIARVTSQVQYGADLTRDGENSSPAVPTQTPVVSRGAGHSPDVVPSKTAEMGESSKSKTSPYVRAKRA